MNDKVLALIYVVVTVLFLSAYPITWVVKSSFESAAYNRLTGAKTTTWDAMFLELRVQESARKE